MRHGKRLETRGGQPVVRHLTTHLITPALGLSAPACVIIWTCLFFCVVPSSQRLKSEHAEILGKKLLRDYGTVDNFSGHRKWLALRLSTVIFVRCLLKLLKYYESDVRKVQTHVRKVLTNTECNNKITRKNNKNYRPRYAFHCKACVTGNDNGWWNQACA